MCKIEDTQNKTAAEIRAMFDLAKVRYDEVAETVRESSRHYISRVLMDTSESNKMECSITMQRGYFGLGENEKPEVVAMWQEPSEGIIWLQFYGMTEPMEFDDLPIDNVMDIIENI